MKLMFIIVRDDNVTDVEKGLLDAKFQITKLSSSGGFLKKGNTTFMSCCLDEDVNNAINIIKDICGKRKNINIDLPIAPSSSSGQYISIPTKLEIGGATIIVTDVCKFEKF